MNKKAKNEWVPYNGSYEKVFYDIKTDDGAEHAQCYPSAGVFHTKTGDEIHEYSVTHFRKTVYPVN